MLAVESLAVGYGTAEVLHDVTMQVDAGRVVALLGNNGAGKTTLLRALSGLLPTHGGKATGGSATIAGRDVLAARPDAIVRSGVAHVPEGRRVFAQLTVEENLMAGGLSVRSRKAVRSARERVHALFPVLAERAGQRAGLLSGGEQQMLAIGRGLMSMPKVLLLDEPSLGIAPLVARQIMATVREINAAGTTVLIVEQNTALALSVADHGYLLDGGRILAEGSPGELAGSDVLVAVSLGMHSGVAS